MSSDSTWRGALRRGRAILVPATAASALVAGALVFAADASAATPPTLTLVMPGSTSNQAQPPSPDSGFLRINNSQNGSSNLPKGAGNQLQVDFTITGPAGLQPGMVTMTYDGSNVTLHGSNGALSGSVNIPVPPGVPAGSDTTHPITVQVNTKTSTSPAFSGSFDTTAALDEYNGNNFVNTIATSNTETTNFVPRSAPSFSNTPTALVNNSYSTQFSGPTYPNPTYTVRWNHTEPNGHVDHMQLTPDVNGNFVLWEGTRTLANECMPGDTSGCADKFIFHTDSGMITAFPQDLPMVDGLPVDNWTITATNLVGHRQTELTLPVLFSDVAPSADFSTEIYTLADQGIINGFSDGTFRPTVTVTRQAFVHFAAGVIDLSAAVGNPVYGGPVATGTCSPLFNPSPFPDVSNNSQFCAEIADLNSRGIINGFSDGTFRPAQEVSRQAIAAFVYRTDTDLKNLDPATASDAECGSTQPFPDVPLSSQFCGDIQWGANNGIIEGFADGNFHPTANASRQAAAAYLYRTEVLEGLQNQL